MSGRFDQGMTRAGSQAMELYGVRCRRGGRARATRRIEARRAARMNRGGRSRVLVLYFRAHGPIIREEVCGRLPAHRHRAVARRPVIDPVPERVDVSFRNSRIEDTSIAATQLFAMQMAICASPLQAARSGTASGAHEDTGRLHGRADPPARSELDDPAQSGGPGCCVGGPGGLTAPRVRSFAIQSPNSWIFCCCSALPGYTK